MSRGAVITEGQIRACNEFLIDGNQVKAYIRAGFNPKNAQKNAHRMFNRPVVQAYLKPLLEKMHAKTLATAEMVLEELSGIAMSNIATFYKRQGKKWILKELDELTTSQQRCISEFKPGEYMKLHSKDGALDKLAKHFKLYTDLEAGTAQFNIMPVLRIGGKEIVFEVGKPAPTAKGSK